MKAISLVLDFLCKLHPTMRIICALIFALAFSSCFAIKLSEEVFKAQNELNLAFKFSELYLMRQEDTWVGNLTYLTSEHMIPGFFKVRTNIIEITANTTEFIESLGTNVCRNNVLNLWKRQSARATSSLQNCMRRLTEIIGQEYYEVTLYHPDAQRLTSHTPNQGLNILSTNSIFDPPNTIYKLVNRRLRKLLGRAIPWILIMDDLDDQFVHHVLNSIVMTNRCYDSVTNNLRAEATKHKEMAESC